MAAASARTAVVIGRIILENAGPDLVIAWNFAQPNGPRPVGVGDEIPQTRARHVR